MPVASRRSKRGSPLIPVIDLFAGPGGLGEGFAADEAHGGTGHFRIALSIEKDATAHQTLELRAFFRSFASNDVPDEYYRHLRGELSRELLFDLPHTRAHAAEARSEAWKAELGVESARQVQARVKAAVARSEESVLIGGPPCQAYSLVGRSRNRGNPDYDPRADGRHTLYREYLKVVATQWPAVFIMENVKGLLSATLDRQSVFERIIDDLSDPERAISGRTRTPREKRYDILSLAVGSAAQSDAFPLGPADRLHPPEKSDYIVRSEDFGVPQARHRLILVGVRRDLSGHVAPLNKSQRLTAAQALRGLPRLRSGISDQVDSATAWRQLLSGSLRDPWYAGLKKTDPDVAGQVADAIDRIGLEELGRGADFREENIVSAIHTSWYGDDRLGGVVNHTTRAHMSHDLKRYLFVSAFGKARGRSPKLADFPVALLPHHENVRSGVEGQMFGDRFRVQLANRPSTTVTSHISKDGHYYIHFDPSQCRSLTPREAARLQTFPDNYFFCGGRTAQYHQIGNAVPPFLAAQIAGVVSAILR